MFLFFNVKMQKQEFHPCIALVDIIFYYNVIKAFSSLHRDHDNLLCIIPILCQREHKISSNLTCQFFDIGMFRRVCLLYTYLWSFPIFLITVFCYWEIIKKQRVLASAEGSNPDTNAERIAADNVRAGMDRGIPFPQILTSLPMLRMKLTTCVTVKLAK